MAGQTKSPGVEVQRKLVVLGFRAVGKSSLTTQFVDGHFNPDYDPTIENTFRTRIDSSIKQRVAPPRTHPYQ